MNRSFKVKVKLNIVFGCEFSLLPLTDSLPSSGGPINRLLSPISPQDNTMPLVTGRGPPRAHHPPGPGGDTWHVTRDSWSCYMLQEDDEGSYSCVAENVLGQTVITAYLDVNHSQVKIFELNKNILSIKNILTTTDVHHLAPFDQNSQKDFSLSTRLEKKCGLVCQVNPDPHNHFLVPSFVYCLWLSCDDCG